MSYGHGAIETAEVAKRWSFWFCVATLDEGIELREAGFHTTYSCIEYGSDRCVDTCSHPRSIYYCGTKEWLEAAATYIAERHLEYLLKLHLKVDTGMGRIGFLQ